MKKIFKIILILIIFTTHLKSLIANPSLLEGRETQNGDFSFAERGRILLEDAIKHLQTNLREVDVRELKLHANLTQSEFERVWQQALEQVQIPTNETLLTLNFADQYFVLDGFVIRPQLDFFLHFGAQIGEVTRIIYLIQCQKLLLEKIGVLLQLESSQGIAFAERILDLLYREESQDHNIKPFVDIAAHLHGDQVFDYLNMIANYQMKAYFAKKLEQYKTLRYEVNSSDNFTHSNDNPFMIYQNCHQINEESQQCKAIDELSYRFFVRATFYNEEEIIAEDEESLSVGLKIFDQGNQSGYFKVSLKIGNDYFEENFSLNYPFDLHFNTVPMDYQLRFDIATRQLKNAQQLLIANIIKLTLEEFAEFIVKSNLPAIQPQWLIEKVKGITIMTFPLYYSAPIVIKNFDYDRMKQNVFVTKTFYNNFGYYESETQKYLQLNHLQRLMLHEVCHLLEKNDQQCSKSVKNFESILQNKEESHDFKSFLIISSIQKDFSVYKQQSHEKLNQIFKDQLANANKYFAERNRIIKNSRMEIVNQNKICLLNRVKVSCSQLHNFYITIYSMKQDIEFEDGQFFTLRYQIQNTIVVDNATRAFGSVKSTFSYVENSFSERYSGVAIVGGYHRSYKDYVKFRFIENGVEQSVDLILMRPYDQILDAF